MKRRILIVLLIVAAVVSFRLLTHKENEPIVLEPLAENTSRVNVPSIPKITKPKPSGQPTVSPDSTSKPNGFEPPQPFTAVQEDALRGAKEVDERWEQSREDFLRKELGLDQSTLASIGKLREDTSQREEKLFASEVSSAEDNQRLTGELAENRRKYETELAKTLGPERWKTYRTHYAQYWHLSEDSSPPNLHSALR